MTAWLLAAACLAVLIMISIAIGAALDTTSQRREWERLAEQRRHLTDETRSQAGAVLCERCPLRRLL